MTDKRDWMIFLMFLTMIMIGGAIGEMFSDSPSGLVRRQECSHINKGN